MVLENIWVEDKGLFCTICIGHGGRIGLKGLNKYPIEEFWEEPEKASMCYQQSKGRGKITTVCYSNIFPIEFTPLIEAGIDKTLTKLELLSGYKYTRGISIRSEEEINLRRFAEELGASVFTKLEIQAQAIETLIHIAKNTPELLPTRKKRMQGIMKRVNEDRSNLSVERLIMKKFNSKVSARNIEVPESGRFEAYNAEQTRITDLYQIVEGREKKL